MAGQVPYTGAPQVQPQTPATPYQQINVTPDAFGANVGAAIRSVGDVQQRAGNEIWERASAIQQLDEQAKANDAQAKYVEGLGNLHAELTSRTGKEAVDYYQNTFIPRAQSLRNEIGASLESPFAQRYFNSESRNQYARAMWSASGHAGTQQRAYVRDTALGLNTANANEASRDPMDEQTFQASLGKIPELVSTFETDPVKAKNTIDTLTSNLWAERIKGVAQRDGILADKWFKQAMANGQLIGSDATQLRDKIDNIIHTKTALQQGNELVSGTNIEYGNRVHQTGTILDALKQIESANGTNTNHPSVTYRSGPNKGMTDIAHGEYAIMGVNILPWLKEAGFTDKTVADFDASPALQRQVAAFQIEKWQKQGLSANEIARNWFGRGATDGQITTPAYLQRFNSALFKATGTVERGNITREMATNQVPDDPVYPAAVEQHANLILSQREREEKADQLTSQTNLLTVMNTPNPQTNQLPNLEDALKDQKFSDAYTRAGPAGQAQIRDEFLKRGTNAYTFNPETQKAYLITKSMLNDPQRTPDETKKLLSMDILNQPWPAWAKMEIAKSLQEVQSGKDIDKSISSAHKILEGQMYTAGINKTKDPEQYHLFNDQLTDAIKVFTETHQRAPERKDIEDIGKGLLSRVPSWFGVGSYNSFERAVPTEEYAKILKDYQAANPGMPDPPENMVKRLYNVKLLQKFWSTPRTVSSW
jgi:hypothetical protein